MLDTDLIEKHNIEATKEKPDNYIACAKCGFVLSSTDYAIEVEGHHEHLQCNPSGLTFVFKCFSKAPGIILSGKPTQEFTWFDEYLWQISHCQNCGEQIGWFFQKNDQERFFGLINDKIRIVGS
mgnify:CR=1 FL=1